MNIYSIIILYALLADYLLSLTADLLNIRNLKGDLPAEFAGVYEADAYKKSQDYTRVKTAFGLIASSFSLLVILVFWFAGGFDTLDLWIRGWHLPLIWTGLCFAGILMFARFLAGLPFSIYSTFVIEQRFGFNKTTPRIFIQDILKGLGLSLIIGGPLFAAVLAFFIHAGSMAWLYCWIFSTVVTLFLQYIGPAWIMPLFNKFTPLEAGDLRETIMNYADRVGYNLSGVYVMDGSKRSTKSNAFFSGFGKNKRIALFDTLIEKHTTKELLTVLAHEIGHYKKKHVQIHMLISILQMGAVFALLSLFLSQKPLFDAFFMTHQPVYAGFVFFGLLYSPVDMLLSMLMGAVSRHQEYQADRFAVNTTQMPDAFIDALKKLSRDNLSNLRPHPFMVFLNYSHPPVLKRIQSIRSGTADTPVKNSES
ncbi:M48 family metallopeptidase [bacterium]|nr:M48 family metallopeptidase [bacterium]